MLTQEQKIILGKLGYYISFLALALPSRSVPTFCELLVASMITAEGFVVQSWYQNKLYNFWGSYHKWLETGHWRTYQVVARFMQLCCLTIPETQPLFLIIDDTFVLRFSDKAPGCAIAYQHAHKLNQARYVLGQCFVYLSMVQERPTDEVPTSIPWLARMSSESGNTSKLFTAKALLRFTRSVIGDRFTYVLLDCWFMRSHVIRHTQNLGFHAIGQVRHDLALFLPPLPEPKTSRQTQSLWGKAYERAGTAISGEKDQNASLRSYPNRVLQKLPLPRQNSQGAGSRCRLDRVRAQGKTP